MPQAAQARAWWADVEDVRERIERKRARERQDAAREGAGPARPFAARRGVREVRPGRHLQVVRAPSPSSGSPAAGSPASGSPASGSPAAGASVAGLAARRRPRPRAGVRLAGPRPDRMAAWAVVLGFALVLAAVLSAHG